MPFFGVSYTYEGPIKSKRFKLSNAIKSFAIHPIEDKKLTIKVSYLKANTYVAHYIIKMIFLSRQDKL